MYSLEVYIKSFGGQKGGSLEPPRTPLPTGLVMLSHSPTIATVKTYLCSARQLHRLCSPCLYAVVATPANRGGVGVDCQSYSSSAILRGTSNNPPSPRLCSPTFCRQVQHKSQSAVIVSQARPFPRSADRFQSHTESDRRCAEKVWLARLVQSVGIQLIYIYDITSVLHLYPWIIKVVHYP